MVQFVFADHILDTDRRELSRGATPIAVEPQVFDLLTYLVQQRERVVSRDDLIATVWRGRIVSDSPTGGGITAARRALGDRGTEQRLTPTFSRKGVRFVGGVGARPRGRISAAGAAATDQLGEGALPALPSFDRPAV